MVTHTDGKYTDRRLPVIMSLANRKLRPGQDTSTHLLAWLKSSALMAPDVDEAVEQREPSLVAAGRAGGCGQPAGQVVVSWKTTHPLRLWFSIMRLFPEEPKTDVHTKTRMWLCIAGVFRIVNLWKQPRYPSAGEWIHRGTSRRWNIIRHYELPSHEETGRERRPMFLSEVTQSEKAAYCVIPLHDSPEEAKPQSHQWLAGVVRRGEG